MGHWHKTGGYWQLAPTRAKDCGTYCNSINDLSRISEDFPGLFGADDAHVLVCGKSSHNLLLAVFDEVASRGHGRYVWKSLRLIGYKVHRAIQDIHVVKDGPACADNSVRIEFKCILG
jgi:hypothetical protein